METDEMGCVLTEATIENMEDLWASKRGMLADDAVRRITVDDALVDTGATLLSVATRMIEQLGLEQTSSETQPHSEFTGGSVSVAATTRQDGTQLARPTVRHDALLAQDLIHRTSKADVS